MMGNLTVVGCGASPQDLAPAHLRAVAAAEVLAGGRRLLAWFPDFPGERVVIDPHPEQTATKLYALARTRRVALLASGDPLFFGIGARFADPPPGVTVTFLPNVTAAQAALARLGLAWAEARFFSVHGRSTPLPWRRILAAEIAVIYTDPKRHPGTVAGDLLKAFPGAASRRAAVAENLGGDDRLFRGALADIAGRAFDGLAVLVLLPPQTSGELTAPPLPLGGEDNTFIHPEGLITHPEIRAVALSKLRLGPGVLWDLGAGSGSVSVEACGLCPFLTAWAVERDGARAEMIRANLDRAGLSACRVVHGEILENLERLPAPRAVFVGGGGREVGEIAKCAFAALRPGGRLVASAVLLESKERLQNILEEARVEIVELDVRRAVPLGPGRMMRPDNPVTLFVFEKA